MDDAGGKENWEYQQEMLKQNVKALIDRCLLISVDYDPPMGNQITVEQQTLTIKLLPKETS